MPGLQNARGDLALTLTAQGSGTVKSGTVAAGGDAAYVFLGVHVTTITGTGPTLDVSLEESDDGSSWTAVPNSAVTQVTAAGNRTAFAVVTKGLVRVSATVGGTTPAVTGRVAVVVFAE